MAGLAGRPAEEAGDGAHARRRPVTIRLEEGVVDHFKTLADETGIPYQTLINACLKECVTSGRRLGWGPPD